MSKLAVLGGKKIRSKKPWPRWPVAGAEEEQQVREVLQGDIWYGGGPKVKQFEQEYAKYHDAAYGVCCVNGSAALEVSLSALGIGAGDEVITTPFTFVATAAGILRANAVPVFADIDPDSANLDPVAAGKAITPRTKAIMPVHVAGLPPEMEKFEALARQHHLRIVYDAAHSWGSSWNDKGIGAYGDFSTVSFQHSKNITAGEGGIILTCDEKLADAAWSYVNVGRLRTGGWYEHFVPGSNYRLSELQAAVLLAQLGRLKAQTQQRMEAADWLNRQLSGIEGLQPAPDDPRARPRSWHLFIIRYDPSMWDGLPRGTFLKALQAEGVPIGDVWPLLYRMPLFAKHPRQGPSGCPLSCPYHQGPVQDYANLHLPHAERLSTQTGMWMAQNVLLADTSDLQDIVDGFTKIRENLSDLVAAAKT
jgi:dTDP-4-amino-4,6-dideoxygalactose transaminase